MPIPSEITELINRLNQELSQIEQDAREGVNLIRPLLSQFTDNVRLIQFLAFFNNGLIEMKEIKNLPDDETLDQLIELAKDFEHSARDLYDLATAIDDKWRIKLEKRRQKIIDESKLNKKSEV